MAPKKTTLADPAPVSVVIQTNNEREFTERYLGKTC